MTTPRYIYDTEEETHRRMQSDPAAVSAEPSTIKQWVVKLIEKVKGDAKVFVQDSESVHPWVLIGRLDAGQTDDKLKEIALQQIQDMWRRG